MNRRSFLAVLAMVTAFPAMSRKLAASAPHENGGVIGLDVVIADADAAARLGRHYLAALTPPPTAEQLVTEITQSMGPVSGGPEAVDDAVIIERARRAVTDDYLQGRVTDVDGWVLSLTEARLFALAALGFPAVH
jgi:hypothetical protein